jgi:hypothetical protein
MNSLHSSRQNFFQKASILAVTAIAPLLATLPLPVQALTLNLVTNRADLGSNDQVDWATLASPIPPFTVLPPAFSATSQAGLGITGFVPPPSVGSGITPPLVFQTSATTIPTNFAEGDYLLFTGFVPPSPTTPPPAIGNPGPLTLDFSTPIFGAGTQIAADDILNYQVSIFAFDATNSLLGSYTINGFSSLAQDNSAVFLGVLSDTPNISRVVYQTSAPERAFGINTLSIAAVPEPSEVLGTIATGIFLAGWTLKRKAARRLN